MVYRARDKQTGEVVALKKVRMDKERDGMPVTALREVRILQSSRHKNIVNLLRVVNGKKPNAIFLVFEYCEHDLARLLETMRVPFTEAESKCLCLQLLQAVEYLHRRWVDSSPRLYRTFDARSQHELVRLLHERRRSEREHRHRRLLPRHRRPGPPPVRVYLEPVVQSPNHQPLRIRRIRRVLPSRV